MKTLAQLLYPDTWITPNRRYVLRNGRRVLVTGPITIKFGPQFRFTWTGIKGLSSNGTEIVWEKNGHYASEGLHELDIVGVAPTAKKTPTTKKRRKA